MSVAIDPAFDPPRVAPLPRRFSLASKTKNRQAPKSSNASRTGKTRASQSDPRQPSARPSLARAIVFRLVAVTLGLLLAFTTIEVVFRVFEVRPGYITKRVLKSPSGRTNYFCYPSNPHGELSPVPPVNGAWKLIPLAYPFEPISLDRLKDTPWCAEYSLSAQGLRDREYGDRPPGVLRIAGLGDSFAAGEGVPLNVSLFKQMERLLGEGYEVVNAAHPGIGTAAELQRLQQISRFQCQRGIVVFIPNDIELSPSLLSRQDFINDLINIRQEHFDRKFGQGAFRSRALEYAREKLLMRNVTQKTTQWYLDCYSDANRDNVLRLEATIRQFAAAPNLPVVFVLYPLLENLENGYPFHKIHQQVGAMLDRAGIPYLDLAPVFEGRKTASLWVHPVDHHPNGKAHAIAAEAIVNWLKRQQPSFLERPTETADEPSPGPESRN
jgi:lysophospholipase L1-like esterase